MKEIEGDTRKIEGDPCSWIKEWILLKYPHYPEWATNSIESASEYQGHSSKNYKKNSQN
jgi:hypothetical protein